MGIFFDNAWLELGLLVAAVFYYLFTRIQKRYLYFEERGIPYLKPVFLLGNTYRSLFGFEMLSETFSRLYEQSKGLKIVGFFQILKPTILIRDPELINQCLIKDFSHFQDHGFKIDTETNPLEGHLFNLQEEKWHAMRKKLSPTFTSGKLKWMFHQMSICTDSLLAIINDESKKGDIEIRDIICRFTTDVIASCAFGFEPSAIKDPNCRFRVMGKKIFDPNLKQIILQGFRLTFPDLFLKLKIKTIPKDINDFFYSVVSQSFEHRMKTGENRNDFIQLLLQLKLKGKIDFDPKDKEEENEEDLTVPSEVSGEENALELTDDVLTAQAFVFFLGGLETSAAAISFTLYLLTKYPEIQDKARKEIRQIKEKHQGQITYDALKEMTYLECCISESMRILPAIDILFRRCTKEKVIEGMKIEKDSTIIFPVQAIQMDPNNFPNPTEFIPERFMDSTNIIPGTYLPFGGGPRICIARRFALVEAKLGIAMILDNYIITKSPKLKEPLVFNPRSLIKQPLNGLWMKFQKIE